MSGAEPDEHARPWRPGRPLRRIRRRLVLAVVALLLLALPVPWRLHLDDQPLALSWRLDGRLSVDGRLVDPAGTWSWLTAGRPPLVAELLVDLLDGTVDASVDVRGGPRTGRSAVVVPVAVATGLRAAGRPVDLGIRVEVAEPLDARYPPRAALTWLDGVRLTDRAAWDRATSRPRRSRTFRLADGSRWHHRGPVLPWADVEVVDVVPDGLDARLFGDLPDLAPIRWASEQLSLGPSHGLMVAVTTWADATSIELDGVHVAGTGGIRGDGVVTAIGGLTAKAGAARAAGADVLLFPAAQADELDDFDAGSMRLVGVASLGDATATLDDLARDRAVEVARQE